MLVYHNKPSIDFQSLTVMVSWVEISATVVACHEILQNDPLFLLLRH